MAEKNPNDIALQILHALKTGLCVKHERNSIRWPEPMHLFNDFLNNRPSIC